MELYFWICIAWAALGGAAMSAHKVDPSSLRGLLRLLVFGGPLLWLVFVPLMAGALVYTVGTALIDMALRRVRR